jgi:MFS family permease
MNPSDPSPRWYQGVTRYQWMVLAIASAGWVFDVFEGQLFALLKTPAMEDVLGDSATSAQADYAASVALQLFLIGGALGGLVFGMMADRIGRRLTMTITILVYSFFTALTAFAQTWEQIAVLRFLVAMGVGGEWAVAAALVAEVFPAHARPAASGIFHASSGLGVFLAGLAGMIVAGLTWRYAFLIGLVPALMVLWIRASMREPERWEAAKSSAVHEVGERLGSFTELLQQPFRRRTLAATGLGIVGLATYWGTYAWAPELAREVLRREALEAAQQAGEVTSSQLTEEVAQFLGREAAPGQQERHLAEMSLLATASPTARALFEKDRATIDRTVSFAYGTVMMIGATAGLLLFAPITWLTNRRIAFALYHVAALIVVPVTFLTCETFGEVLFWLPLMGFVTVGMHAGYAIYFPELFPTRLRATGAGFCFNAARLIAGPVIWFRGWLRDGLELGLRTTVSLMALLFVFGLICLLFTPETKDQPLPE